MHLTDSLDLECIQDRFYQFVWCIAHHFSVLETHSQFRTVLGVGVIPVLTLQPVLCCAMIWIFRTEHWKDHSHPGSHLFNLLPSGRCYRCIKSQTNRLPQSYNHTEHTHALTCTDPSYSVQYVYHISVHYIPVQYLQYLHKYIFVQCFYIPIPISFIQSQKSTSC